MNGHTPISAVIAFSAVLAAYLKGKAYVVLSNESSANEVTVAGTTINHQYSKSYAFEKDLRAYIARCLPVNISYFSLLRPYSELQIVAYFARLSPFHATFNSCNLGSKTDSWCLACPKCLFTYIMLSPFLSHAQLLTIFSEDLLDKPRMKSDFDKLVGIERDKPFECVGRREEVNTALVMAVSRYENENRALPHLLAYYRETPLFRTYQTHPVDFVSTFDTENSVPSAFLQRLMASPFQSIMKG